jgi:hypothetical protein
MNSMHSRARDGVHMDGGTTLPLAPSKRHAVDEKKEKKACLSQSMANCCCIQRKKEKVENDHGRRENYIYTIHSYSPTLLLQLIVFILIVQLTINYCVLQLNISYTMTAAATTAAAAAAAATTTTTTTSNILPPSNYRSSASIPQDAFIAEYYHFTARSQPPASTNMYKSIDFLPPAPKISKLNRFTSGWESHRGKKKKTINKKRHQFPPKGINRNEFVGIFRGKFTFDEGQYRFVVASSSDVRVWIDNTLLINEFVTSSSLSLSSLSEEEADDTYHNVSPIVEKVLITINEPGEHIVTVQYAKKRTITGRNNNNNNNNNNNDDDEDGDNGRISWIDIANDLLSSHLHVHWIKDSIGLKVYVYDLPTRFNKDIVDNNEQCSNGHMFGAELAIHQDFKTSIVRTMDPREADLFYVPVYTTCQYLGKPFFGIDPWFGKDMVEKSVQYISKGKTNNKRPTRPPSKKNSTKIFILFDFLFNFKK